MENRQTKKVSELQRRQPVQLGLDAGPSRFRSQALGQLMPPPLMAHLEELHVSRFNRASSGAIAAHPWAAMALGLVLVLGAGARAPRGSRRISPTRASSISTTPSFRSSRRSKSGSATTTPSSSRSQSPSGVYDTETIALVQWLTEQIWQVPEVIRVESITNYNWLHGARRRDRRRAVSARGTVSGGARGAAAAGGVGEDLAALHCEPSDGRPRWSRGGFSRRSRGHRIRPPSRWR